MNPVLLHCRQILYQLSQKGSPRTLEWVKVKVSQLCLSLCDPMDCSLPSSSVQPTKLFCPWDSPGKNTGVGCHSLLQGIFFTQGSNLHCRQILYQLSHKGSPRLLEGVAYPFSRGSSQPRNWTRVSCIAEGFFTNWAIREAPYIWWQLFLFYIHS